MGQPPPNDRLRTARLRTLSPSGSGRPMSRQELADAVNTWLYQHDPSEATLDANYIGKLERGEHRWPSRPRRHAIAQVLGAVRDADLGFYINRTAPTAVDDVAVRTPEQRAEANMGPQRRALLKAISGVAAGCGLLAGPPYPGRRRVGATDVARINAVTVLYRSVDYECGGGALCEEVGRFAEATSALLRAADANRVERDLAAAVASARQLAGWTAFDAGRYSDAQRHWLSAERAAIASGDLRLTARIRYCQARQFQHLHHNQDALDTLSLARAQLADQTTPALLAMLHGAEAASLAALGDHDNSLLALAAATEHFEHIEQDREPEWMRFYDRGELLAQYGRVYRDLARTDRRHADAAVGWVTAAIGAFGASNVRSTVLNEVGLCSALLLAGEPDQAINIGTRVITRGQQLTSRRVLERIRNVRRDIPHDPRASTLLDFRDVLTRIMPAAA
jgi:hypothetical protein